MDKQAVFDKVAKHLLTQGKKAEAASDHRLGFICKYRAPDGSKCAVGCLIPDELYSAGFEGATVGGLPKNVLEAIGVETDADLPLLRALQSVHDQYQPDQWNSSLKYVAEKYELSPVVVEGFGK